MDADNLRLSEEASRRAKILMECGEPAKALEAYLQAAEYMMRFSGTQQGKRKADAQNLVEALLIKARQAKEEAARKSAAGRTAGGSSGADRGGYSGTNRGSGYPDVDRGGYPGADRGSGYPDEDRGSGRSDVDRGGYPGTDRGSGSSGADSPDAGNRGEAGGGLKPDRGAGNREAADPGGNRSAISRDLESWRKNGRAGSGSDVENRLKFVPVPSPNVHFSDIAGLDNVKSIVRLKVIEPILHPELYERFAKTSNGGILLYGPPGTGKTMIARAIATETGLDFFSVRCSDIVGKSFGDGERNLKGLFDAARESGRAMIFFDEFESLACKRGGNSTVMNRIVPELLSQMDGFQQNEGLLVILASTNRPWDLDSAVLRPPRMTERIYVGLPDFPARHYIVKKALEPLPKQELLDYDQIAQALEGFNCADITAFVERVKEAPIQRGLSDHSVDQYITAEDVENALARSHSSVQKSDLEAFSKWEASQQ